MASKRLKFFKLNDIKGTLIEITSWNVKNIIGKLGFPNNMITSNNSSKDQIFMFNSHYYEDIHSENYTNLASLPLTSKIFFIYFAGEKEFLETKYEELIDIPYSPERYEEFLDNIQDPNQIKLYKFTEALSGAANLVKNNIAHLKNIIGKLFISFYDILDIAEHEYEVMNEFDKMIDRFTDHHQSTINPSSNELLKNIKEFKILPFEDSKTFILKKFWDEKISKILPNIKSVTRGDLDKELANEKISNEYHPISILRNNLKMFEDKINLYNKLKDKITKINPDVIEDDSDDPNKNKLEEENRELLKKIEKIQKENKQLKAKNTELSDKCNELDLSLDQQQSEIDTLLLKLKQKDNQIAELNQTIKNQKNDADSEEFNTILTKYMEVIKSTREENNKLTNQVKTKEAEIQELISDYHELNEKYENDTKIYQKKAKEYDDLKRDFDEKISVFNALVNNCDDKDRTYSDLKIIHEELIRKIKNQSNRLKNVYLNNLQSINLDENDPNKLIESIFNNHYSALTRLNNTQKEVNQFKSESQKDKIQFLAQNVQAGDSMLFIKVEYTDKLMAVVSANEIYVADFPVSFAYLPDCLLYMGKIKSAPKQVQANLPIRDILKLGSDNMLLFEVTIGELVPSNIIMPPKGKFTPDSFQQRAEKRQLQQLQREMEERIRQEQQKQPQQQEQQKQPKQQEQQPQIQITTRKGKIRFADQSKKWKDNQKR